eukprot:scaffold1970_cov396-Prasinococcus_capsulatus_cf.AAC.18
MEAVSGEGRGAEETVLRPNEAAVFAERIKGVTDSPICLGLYRRRSCSRAEDPVETRLNRRWTNCTTVRHAELVY